MLKIALVQPKGFEPLYTIPVSLGFLVSNLDGAKYDARVFDCALRHMDAHSEEFRRALTEFSPDIVGVSSWSQMFPEALSVLRLAKRLNPSVTTIIGGQHATAYSDKVMENREIDFLFRGEAELSLQVFLEEFGSAHRRYHRIPGLVYRSKGGLIKNEIDRVKDLDQIRWPDYDAMHLDEYLDRGYKLFSNSKRNAPIFATRGCPYRCSYCYSPDMNGKAVRRHSIEYLIKLIKHLYYEKNVRWIDIIDDNFTFHVKFAKEFCRKVIEMNLDGLGFSTTNGIRMQRGDKELWALMKQAGWQSLFIAPESGSPNTIAKMRKDLKLEIVPQVIEDIKEAGLKVSAYFIIGYPGETKQDLEETLSFIRKLNIDSLQISNFQPLPGTPIYDELVAEGKITEGVLPNGYSDGSRVYTPEELKDVNFPYIILRTYFLFGLRKPVTFLRMLRYLNIRYVFKKVFQNLKKSFRGAG